MPPCSLWFISTWILLSILIWLVGSLICAPSPTRRLFLSISVIYSAFPVVDAEFKLELACEAPKAEAPKAEEKEEEEEEDLFGDDDDDEDDEAAAAMEAKIRAEAEKKKAEKEANKKVEKSLMVINVKPYDEETDLKALFKKIQETEVKGCKWSETCNILPLAYGISYIQLSCVIEDEVCCEDDVIDAITQFEDEVQSTEVASFNKFS